jgi:hypothetical protein
MAELSAHERDKLSDNDFALPGRRYPIDTEARARDALARISEFGSATERRRVRMLVKHRYPDIEVEGLGKE